MSIWAQLVISSSFFTRTSSTRISCPNCFFSCSSLATLFCSLASSSPFAVETDSKSLRSAVSCSKLVHSLNDSSFFRWRRNFSQSSWEAGGEEKEVRMGPLGGMLAKEME